MPDKKPYRSALRSRHLIREAFLSLLPEKGPDKITVSDIVRRANINRSTFYAHYPDVQGIVEEIQSEIFCRHGHWRNNPASEICLECIFDILQEHQALLHRIHNPRLQAHLQAIVEEMLRCCSENSSTIPGLSTQFLLGGILSAYQSWSQGDIDCTAEEIYAYIASLLGST